MKDDITTKITTILVCCGLPMKRHGHLERRGCSGGKRTRLAYECTKCFLRVEVAETWGEISPATLAAMDATQ